MKTKNSLKRAELKDDREIIIILCKYFCTKKYEDYPMSIKINNCAEEIKQVIKYENQKRD
jgi:hypothetical protein